MTPSLLLFGLLVLVLGALMVLYVASVRFVRAEGTPGETAVALVPLATPFVAFHVGARVLPIAFVGLVTLYVFLWLGAPR